MHRAAACYIVQSSDRHSSPLSLFLPLKVWGLQPHLTAHSRVLTSQQFWTNIKYVIVMFLSTIFCAFFFGGGNNSYYKCRFCRLLLAVFMGFRYLMITDPKWKKKILMRLLSTPTLTSTNPNHIHIAHLKSFWVSCDWNLLAFGHGVVDHCIIE